MSNKAVMPLPLNTRDAVAVAHVRDTFLYGKAPT